MVTQEQLDGALQAWQVARESAVLEQQAWATVLSSHATLIASLRANGHSWSEAQTQFERLSDGHSKALLAAWGAMDSRCLEYRALRAAYLAQ